MKFKFAVPALVAASLFGATAIASAQTGPAQPAPSAGVESDTGPSAHDSGPSRRAATRSSRVKSGTTTGMSSYGAGKAKPGGQSTARKPPGS
jgi:hypothetical protein